MSGTIAHGGAIDRAAARYPDAPQPWIDLSTGINPVAYPLPPLDPSLWQRLPLDAEVAACEAAARIAYGLPIQKGADLVAAPGTQALIQTLPHLLAAADRPASRRAVQIAGPTYGEYAPAFAAAGYAVEEYTAGGIADWTVLDPSRGIVLCQPNNPDGRRLPLPVLQSLIDRVNAADGFLLLDAAFADADEESAADLGAGLAGHIGQPGLVILRSFGKFYGLAGVRLGFALGPAALMATLRQRLGPWAVSGPALRIGACALADQPWAAATRSRLRQHAERLDRLLVQAGLTILGGTTLFRLAQHSAADRIADHLARAGILVRRFPAQPDWLRFGLPGTDGGWDRLEAALRPPMPQ